MKGTEHRFLISLPPPRGGIRFTLERTRDQQQVRLGGVTSTADLQEMLTSAIGEVG